MERIIVNTTGAVSEIIIGADWKENLPLLPVDGTVIITDSNVNRIYGKEFPGYPVIEIKPGEDSKCLGEIERLSEELLKAGIGRSGFILGIGGGVVCDIAGFLSSIFMRGIRCGYVSTSLLSQVDASTGGKTGVNLGKVKNVIGSFRQPEFVICDTKMLQTLPDEEYLSGLAELIKTGLIGDSIIINMLENNYSGIIDRDREILSVLVTRAVEYKASIVSQDEKESSIRRILNFGHTFGHVLELHESLKHGFAVAWGIEIAAVFSDFKGLISSDETSRIIELLNKYNLLKKYNMPVELIEEFTIYDKKRTGADIFFVFLEGIGKGLVKKVPLKEIIEFYRQYNDK